MKVSQSLTDYQSSIEKELRKLRNEKWFLFGLLVVETIAFLLFGIKLNLI
jgi:hypothetical protein